jgi:hypothetical protein
MAIARNSDQLTQRDDAERHSLITFDNEMRIRWAVHGILDKLSAGERREQSLEQAFEVAGLTLVSAILWTLGREHGRFGDGSSLNEVDELTVGATCVDRLQATAAQKLRQAADDGSLQRHPKALLLARDWRAFEDGGAAQDWVNRVAEDDEGLAGLLLTAQSKTASRSSDDWVATEGLSAGADFLLTWFDGVRLRQRCQEILRRNEAWQSDRIRAGLQLIVDSIDEKGSALDPITRRQRGEPSAEPVAIGGDKDDSHEEEIALDGQ